MAKSKRCPECTDRSKICTKPVCPLIPDEWTRKPKDWAVKRG